MQVGTLYIFNDDLTKLIIKISWQREKGDTLNRQGNKLPQRDP